MLDAPDDDMPRLVYADWLSDQGDARGEFIVIQIEIAKDEENANPSLREREAELLKKHKKKWTSLAPGGRVTTTIGNRTVHG